MSVTTEQTSSIEPDKPVAEEKAGTSFKDVLTPIIALLILIGFGIFIWYLMRNLDLGETEWARATYLFAGVEAVAFAAAGYFFGTQVQRGRVEEAKAEAQAATQVAARADEVAEAERSNATMLAEGIVSAAQGDAGGGLAGPGDAAGPRALDPVLAQAHALLRERGRR